MEGSCYSLEKVLAAFLELAAEPRRQQRLLLALLLGMVLKQHFEKGHQQQLCCAGSMLHLADAMTDGIGNGHVGALLWSENMQEVSVA